MMDFEKEAASRRFFFRKENRVLRRADFQKIYSNGQVFRRSLLHIFILPPKAGSCSPTRLGITATRKSGNAVRRNRGRRLIRESFRHILPDLKPGYSIVVNVMRAATLAEFKKVDQQLRSVLKEAGVFVNMPVAFE